MIRVAKMTAGLPALAPVRGLKQSAGGKPDQPHDQHLVVGQVITEGHTRPEGAKGIFLDDRAEDHPPEGHPGKGDPGEPVHLFRLEEGGQPAAYAEQDREEHQDDMRQKDVYRHIPPEADDDVLRFFARNAMPAAGALRREVCECRDETPRGSSSSGMMSM